MRAWWNGLSNRRRLVVVAASASDAVLKVVALRDLKCRPAEQIRGPKWAWALLVLVNSAGLTSLSYLVLGRRRDL